jgi:hypothetical protein
MLRKHDGVMVLELRNPPANTYSYDMMRELDAHVLDARMDESVHVLMITGARPAAPEAGNKQGPSSSAPAPTSRCSRARIPTSSMKGRCDDTDSTLAQSQLERGQSAGRFIFLSNAL